MRTFISNAILFGLFYSIDFAQLELVLVPLYVYKELKFMPLLIPVHNFAHPLFLMLVIFFLCILFIFHSLDIPPVLLLSN